MVKTKTGGFLMFWAICVGKDGGIYRNGEFCFEWTD